MAHRISTQAPLAILRCASAKTRRATTIIAASAVFVAGHASAVMYNRDTGDSQSRTLANLPPFSSKAHIGGCSAVLIAPNVLLSAAHCTNYANTGTLTASWNGQNRSGAVFTRLGADTMVIVTNTPFTGTTGNMTAPYNGGAELNRLVWKVGRGGHGVIGVGSSGPFYDGIFRAMTNRIEVNNVSSPPNPVQSNWLYYDFDGPPSQPQSNRATTWYEGGTAPGDSGGPLYMFENGRWYVVGVTSGPDAGYYRDGRVRTDISQIQSITGHQWARPVAPALTMRWVAQDLAASLADGAAITHWPRSGGSEAWTHQAADGATGTVTLAHHATPAGTAAAVFPGTGRLGLPAAQNPVAGRTAFTLAMVVRMDASGIGEEGAWFQNTGLIDAEESGTHNDWGLAVASTGKVGLGIGNPDATRYSGPSLGTGQWRVVVASWDGAEISGDASGSDRNMSVYVDSAASVTRTQGPEFLNVARSAVHLTLGGSRSASNFLHGRIAELRVYHGALDDRAVDSLIREMRSQHIGPQLELALSQPAGGRAVLPPGQGLILDGSTPGATGVAITQTSGPASATLSPANALPCHVVFPAAGTYQFNVAATDASSTLSRQVTVEVLPQPSSQPSLADFAVPGAWTALNIGDATTSGNLTSGATTASLTGAGMGFQEMSDSLRFAWKPLTGNGSITARVTGFSANNGGKAYGGLMLRSSLRRESANVAATVISGGGLRFTRRSEDSAYTEPIREELSAPYWLRLTRQGNTFTCHRSADGTTWQQLGPAETIPAAPATMHAGFMIASINNNGNSVINLDNLSLVESGASTVLPTIEFASGQNPSTANHFSLNATTAEPVTWSWQKISGPGNVSIRTQNTANPQVAFSQEGTHVLRATASSGGSSTFVDQTIQVSLDARWDFDSTTEGWNGNNATASATAGILSAAATSGDPQLSKTNATYVDGDLARYVVVRYRGSATGNAQLFWGRVGASGFTGSRVTNASYSSANTWQTLVFHPSAHPDWAGQRITDFRFDPTGGAGSTFEIDWIALSTFDPNQPPPAADEDGDGVADNLEILRYWNASPLSQTWQTGASHWNTGPLGSGSQGVWNPGDDVIFDQPSAYTVTLGAPFNPGRVTLVNGQVTFAGSGSLHSSLVAVQAAATLAGDGDRLFRPGTTRLLLDGTFASGAATTSAERLITLEGVGNVTGGALRVASGTFAGAFSGSASLLKESPASLILTGPNSHTGPTHILAGNLQIGNGGSSGSLGQTAVTNHGTLVFQRSDALTWSGSLHGGGALVKSGTNTLTLTGEIAHSGPTTIAGGMLQIGNGGTSGSLNSGPVANGGTIRFHRSDFSSCASDISGGLFSKLGAGTLLLSGNNSFGSGTLNLGGGTQNVGYLRLAHPKALGNYTKINLASNTSGVAGIEVVGGLSFPYAIDTLGRNTAAGSTFLRNIADTNLWEGNITFTNTGGSYDIESLAGELIVTGTITTAAITAPARTFNIKGPGDVTLQGPVTESATCPIALIKAGTGTLRLNAANTFSSAITLNGGTLLVNGSVLPAITAAAGTTLGGHGTLTSANLSGTASLPTTLSPGDSTPATLTASGTVTLGPHSRLLCEIANLDPAANQFDRLAAAAISLTATPASPLTLTLLPSATLSPRPAETTFPVLTANTLTGFNPAAITLDASAMPPELGSWSLRQAGQSLELVLAPADSFPAWIAGFPSLADPSPEADPDADGWPNQHEWLTGTDPTDPSSRFSTTLSSAGITFTTRAGRVYQVEISENLTRWEIHQRIETTTPQGEITVPPPDDPAPTRFFRVRVSLPD